MSAIKTVKPRLNLAGVAVVGIALLVGGCASSKLPPGAQVSESITSSNEAVRQAEQVEAQDYAPLELRTAKQKLERARQAAEDGDDEKAWRLAEQAKVDAELAEVKALSAKAQEAVDELRESIQTLREEIERGKSQ